jgi:hypothetical protein
MILTYEVKIIMLSSMRALPQTQVAVHMPAEQQMTFGRCFQHTYMQPFLNF